jgi:hypothetical protein
MCNILQTIGPALRQVIDKSMIIRNAGKTITKLRAISQPLSLAKIETESGIL